MKKYTCVDCRKRLKKDEVALTRKLIDADAENFYCLECMADNIGCTVEDLKEKIMEFKNVSSQD